jgi:hypothetical protein
MEVIPETSRDYKLNRIDPINKITKLNKYLVKDIIYNAEREIKSLG